MTDQPPILYFVTQDQLGQLEDAASYLMSQEVLAAYQELIVKITNAQRIKFEATGMN
jgi:hypothetical protein